MREGPDHYTRLKPEPIDVIRAWDLPWCTANALKYIARYRNKGGVEDLKKARHYLDMEIAAMEEDETCEVTVNGLTYLFDGDEWVLKRPEPVPPKNRK